jgi:peptidoglycan-N-acetylglucosamine deacetylase
MKKNIETETILRNRLWVGVFLLLLSFPSLSIEMAITVDDLPLNGSLSQESSLQTIQDKFLAAFKKYQIQGVYGFVNGKQVDHQPGGRGVLQAWTSAGHYLGNHTRDHLNLSQVSAQTFIQNIQANEPYLNEGRGKANYFRYPYLDEGNTQEKYERVHRFLDQNKYTQAPVSLDFSDYLWLKPYLRCLEQKDEQGIKILKKTYLQYANQIFELSRQFSNETYGRDIHYILLIHYNLFTAQMLDELLASYRDKAKFIALDEALQDPAYALNPSFNPKTIELTFLETSNRSRRVSFLALQQKQKTQLQEICNRVN